MPGALTLASCSRYNEEPKIDDNGSSIEVVPMTIGAEVLQPISRAEFERDAYDGDETYGDDAIIWKQYDEITVYFTLSRVLKV